MALESTQRENDKLTVWIPTENTEGRTALKYPDCNCEVVSKAEALW